jgi:hypothetical protein
VVGIGGKRPLVPDFGIVIAAELAAGITKQRRDIRMIVVAQRLERRDAGDVVALVVDQSVGRVIVAQEILGGAALGLLVLRFILRFVLGFLFRLRGLRRLRGRRRGFYPCRNRYIGSDQCGRELTELRVSGIGS